MGLLKAGARARMAARTLHKAMQTHDGKMDAREVLRGFSASAA